MTKLVASALLGRGFFHKLLLKWQLDSIGLELMLLQQLLGSELLLDALQHRGFAS